jgi:uncharacterized protein (TIGR00251 family)
MPIQLDVKVVPSSGRVGLQMDKSGNFKCYLKSPPEKGKANQELIKLLAKLLHIGQENISIVSGLTSRKKRISIRMDISYEQLLQLLSLDKQTSLFAT